MAPRPASSTTARSRALRQRILQVLQVHYAAGTGLACSLAAIRDGLSGSPVPFDEAEIRVAIQSLLADELIAAAEGDGWVLTADGNEFLDADCPWGQIDRFLGRKGGTT